MFPYRAVSFHITVFSVRFVSRFRRLYRSVLVSCIVPFCFVYARAFTMEQRSLDGLAIARAGLRPLSKRLREAFIHSQEAAKRQPRA